MIPPRRDFSLRRLRARACSRLPGNRSAGQGSRKPRCRIHVSEPLRGLARGHVSMVSRWRKPGNRIFPGHSAGDGTAPAAACRAAADVGAEEGRGGTGYGGEFGINGESSGKDGANTNVRSSLVLSELRRVTCGVAVHKAVDNYRDVRITGGILWTRCGQEKNLK